ncbi:hypothetical protein J2X77_004826 [Sphingobacterium sp. 2149]|nr:hypothetical protein [Sphingobacterium sp. 2149]
MPQKVANFLGTLHRWEAIYIHVIKFQYKRLAYGLG